MVLLDLVPHLGFRHQESYWLFYATIAWFLAWGGYWITAFLRRHDPDLEPWHWSRLVGLAMVLWPFVKLAYGVYTSFGLVLDPDSVARAVPTEAWWAAVRRRSVQYVLLPLVGAFLMFGLHERGRGMRLGARVQNLFLRIGLWPRRSLVSDLANGAWLFVALYFGYTALTILLSPLERLNNGDESAVFDGVTPALALALALTAGVTEELLFRGILQTRLQRILPVWAAILIQSVFFGLIHSGYGTIGHVLFPALFGVAMGLVMLFFGLTPAIMVHAGVNLVIFLAIASDNGYPWTLGVIPWIFVAAIVLPALYYTLLVVRRERARRASRGATGPQHGEGGPPLEEPPVYGRNP